MKYPAILQTTLKGNPVCLAFNKYFGFVLNEKIENHDIIHFSYHQYKNITAEYLANTYGEVKSKAHAEFIVKLATKHGIKVWNCWNEGKYFNFHTDQNGGLNLEFSNEEYAKRNGEKQITIPLPPEREGVAINNDHEFEFVDCTFTGDKINTKSEWPKVGDEVVLDDEVGIVKLPADAQDYYIVEVNGLYKQCRFGELSKPKTPEQIMQENLINIYESSLDGGHFIDNLLSEYTLIKKPQ